METNNLSRRSFVKLSTLATAATITGSAKAHNIAKDKPKFPLIDYHVHTTDDFTIDKAVALAESRGMKFGMVEHPGPNHAIKNDDDLERYIEKCRNYPVYVGVQPTRRNWSDAFSPRIVDQLDYILMDADTVPLGDGKFLDIWRHNNYINSVEDFMEQYMAHIIDLLTNEPINIFARPTYLPVNFARYYDELWTSDRVNQMIGLAAKNNIAFEISTPMHVPKKEIILKAKAAGIKFTFGTNARNNDAGKIHYGLQMVEECGLGKGDMLVL